MAGDTSVTIVGNLVADPELRFTQSGVAVCNFRVASTPRHFDKATAAWVDGEPLFLGVTVWRDAANHAAETLTRGARVVVTGNLRARPYEKDGEKRTSFEVEAEEVGASLRYASATIQRRPVAAVAALPDQRTA